MSDKDSGGSKLDVSQLRTPIQISGKPIEQVLSSIHYGSPELRCLLLDECDLIFECKVCRALFRDLPNFISHKRAYCTKSSTETRHVTIANLPEEKVVVVQPQAPEETEKGSALSVQNRVQRPKSPRAKLEETIMRIQTGELGRSQAYQVYTEAAEKLQRQKEGMKVAMIRTTPIPTNKNAVFIDVNVTSVNIHERQQQVNSGTISSYDQSRGDSFGSVIKRKAGDRMSSTRHERKSIRQERHSSEPQKLLMDQLKEIQHKVKQKVAAAQDKVNQQKKARTTLQTNSSDKDSCSSTTKDELQKTVAGTNTLQAQEKMSNNVGLPDTTVMNLKSSKEETESDMSDESDSEEVKYALVRHRVDNKIRSKATKENKSSTASAVKSRRKLARKSPICSKCNAIFATRKSLGFHMKIHHSPKRTFYPCPYCQSVFYYFFGITRHLSRNHSKSLEEINTMRKQLREKSYTQPVGTVSPKKEIIGVSNSSMSTRSIRGSRLTSLSQVTHSNVVVPLSCEKQQPKRTSGNSETSITDSQMKTLSQKISQTNSFQGHDKFRQAAYGKTESEHNKSSNAKESMGESRTGRLKNRQQQKLVENTGKSVSDNLIDTYSEMYTPTPSPASSSAMSEEHQENTSHVCPNCQRSFGRIISYKNHLKVCKSDSDSFHKTAQTVNIGHKSRQSGSSATVGNKLNASKTKGRDRANSSSHIASEYGSDVFSMKGLDVEHKNQSRTTSSEKCANSAQIESANRITTSSWRSSSVDRALKGSESRNRSTTRNTSLRDKRDSSVESTQSSKEGKSPRSRRNVLSRYATPVQLSVSPLKLGKTLKTNFSSDTDQMMEDHALLPMAAVEKKMETSKNLLNASKGKASEADNDEGMKSEVDSASGSDKDTSSSRIIGTSNTNQNNCRAEIVSEDDASESLFVDDMNKPSTDQSHKAFLSPQMPNVSSPKLQDLSFKSDINIHKSSPHKNLSPKKLQSSPRLQRISPLSSSKPETHSHQCQNSESKSLISTNKSVKNQKIKTEFKEIRKEELGSSSDTGGSNLEEIVQMDATVTENQGISKKSESVIENFMKATAQSDKEQIEEKQSGLSQVDCDSGNSSFTTVLTKQPDYCLVSPKHETVSEEQSIFKLENSALSSKIEDVKPQAMQKFIVVSALSERPKRKRKVPSRNKDAEEMLSKIHSHNRETVPGKKAKVSFDTKARIMPKQKSRNTEKVASGEHTKEDFENGRNKLTQETCSFDEDEDEGENSNEESGKTKGRIVSNRTYVLEKCGTKGKRLKCYDQVKVYKLIDEENLKCLECGESCSQVSNLRRHVIRQHLRWSRFKCKLCKFESYDRSECTTHLIRGHRNRTINLRNVNQYIVDLVKQGSFVRSLKKNQTLKVKQQSESQEGNIYARPTVKKIPRLPQRAEDESKNSPHGGLCSKIDKSNMQTRSSEEQQSHSSVEVKPFSSSHVAGSEHLPVMVTVQRKQISLNSSPKMGTSSKKLTDQSQTTAKSELTPVTVVNSDASSNVPHKNPTFNISTRNSPRTFDTRPYNPGNNRHHEAKNSGLPKEESLSKVGKRVVAKVISPTENKTNKTGTKIDDSIEQVVAVPNAAAANSEHVASAEFPSAGDILRSRSSLEKLIVPSTSSVDLNSHNSENSGSFTKATSSVVRRLDAAALSLPASQVFEIKVESPRNLLDLSVESKQLIHPTSAELTTTSAEKVKPNLTGFIIRKPQQKVLAASSESVTSGQLAFMKLKGTGDQFHSSASTPSSQHVLKTALMATRLSAPVIDIASLQGRQTHPSVSAATVKTTALEHVKIAPQRPTAPSHTAPGSSGVVPPVAVAISTTAASSFLLGHGQVGKFIIYTRPAGAKELTAVIRSSPVSSPLPSAPSVATVIKPPEPNPQPGSETPETVPEDVFPPGTIVLRKQYL